MQVRWHCGVGGTVSLLASAVRVTWLLVDLLPDVQLNYEIVFHNFVHNLENTISPLATVSCTLKDLSSRTKSASLPISRLPL